MLEVGKCYQEGIYDIFKVVASDEDGFIIVWLFLGYEHVCLAYETLYPPIDYSNYSPVDSSEIDMYLKLIHSIIDTNPCLDSGDRYYTVSNTEYLLRVSRFKVTIKPVKVRTATEVKQGNKFLRYD